MVWGNFRNFRFDLLAPDKVTSVEWVDGTPAKVGSCGKITYGAGTTWTVRLTEVSERHHTIAYEIISAEPALHVTSLQAEIKLLRVSDDNTTFLAWTSEFSNDADLGVIQD